MSLFQIGRHVMLPGLSAAHRIAARVAERNERINAAKREVERRRLQARIDLARASLGAKP